MLLKVTDDKVINTNSPHIREITKRTNCAGIMVWYDNGSALGFPDKDGTLWEQICADNTLVFRRRPPLIREMTEAEKDQVKSGHASVVVELIDDQDKIMVKQRSDFDCALASIAMASGKPYEELFDAEFCAKIEEAKTCTGDNLEEAYRRAGFISGVTYWSIFTGMAPDFPVIRKLIKGRRAILQVPSLNYEKAQHLIYWDGNELHDPSNKLMYRFIDSVFPTYVTLFDEATKGGEQ